MKKIIFSHGKESGPWGTKIKYLAEIASENGYGYVVESIDYTNTEDQDERVSMLKNHVQNENTGELVLVGSSMGGYVSTVFASQHPIKGLFLLAPALYIPNWGLQEYQPQCEKVAVVHGWHDDVIPLDNSIKFARENNCTLHVVNSDHRLNDKLELLGGLFLLFLRGL
ncbi:MAG: lysophospholipase [Gammaproteobacteria bacterium]|nr:lysophospholipase [Gammaproteobacteria bacterium]